MTNFEIIQLMREMKAGKLTLKEAVGTITVTRVRDWVNGHDIDTYTITRPEGETTIEVTV